MADFLTALGLVFVIEGVLYAAAPGRMREMLRMALDQPDETLRKIGLVAAATGVAIVWAIRG